MTRRAIRLLGFGLLGLFISVAIAWVLALRTDLMTGPRQNFRTGMFMLEYPAPHQGTTWTFFPITQWGILQLSASNCGPLSSSGAMMVSPAERMAEAGEVPAWSVMRRGDGARGVFDAVYLEQAFGFPMLAMTQRYRWVSGNTGLPETNGLPTPAALKPLGRGQSLPVRFIAPGAAVDAAVWGWVCYSVLAFPSIVRRTVRRWRRVCPGCGYDLRHVKHERCPECGMRC